MGPRALVLIALVLAPLAGCLGDEDETQSKPNDQAADPQDPGQGGSGAGGSSGSDRDQQSGSGDSSDGSSDDSPRDQTGGQDSSTDGTGDGTPSGNGSNASPKPNVTFKRERHEGNLSGADAGLNLTGPEEVVNVTIEPGATQLWFNLSVDGSALQLDAIPPGCESTNCSHTTTTEDGQAVLPVSNPESGTWTARLHAAEAPTLVEADYDLAVTQRIVAG